MENWVAIGGVGALPGPRGIDMEQQSPSNESYLRQQRPFFLIHRTKCPCYSTCQDYSGVRPRTDSRPAEPRHGHPPALSYQRFGMNRDATQGRQQVAQPQLAGHSKRKQTE